MNATKEDIIGLGAEIIRLRHAIDRQTSLIERLADKLIQMAMVQSGDGNAAVAHRSQSRRENQENSENSPLDPARENTVGNTDFWDDDKGEWPPSGCDVMTPP